MVKKMLKAALWQSVEKPEKIGDYIATVISWIIVIVVVAAINVFLGTTSLNKYLVLFLRILFIVVIPYIFPALHISTDKGNKAGSWLLFRFHSIIGALIAPIYVYKYLSSLN